VPHGKRGEAKERSAMDGYLVCPIQIGIPIHNVEMWYSVDLDG
jgi:hypothetical protein